MDMNETITELQKFADANNLNMDVSGIVDMMDAGDFIEINQAMDSSNNIEIVKILQKYKARMNENYKFFSSNLILENNSTLKTVQDMNLKELTEMFKKSSQGFMYDNSHLSIAELKTLVYEDLSSSLQSAQSQINAGHIAKSTTPNSQQINPQTAAKLKQSDIQKNSGNPNYKVQIPGQSGQAELADVIGVDVGPTTQQTLVVTKDPANRNQVDVFGLDDIQPIKEEIDEDNESEELSEMMSPDQSDLQQSEGSLSVLSMPNPDMADMIDAITDITREPEVTDGSESVQGNSALDNTDEIDAIINFCQRMDR